MTKYPSKDLEADLSWTDGRTFKEVYKAYKRRCGEDGMALLTFEQRWKELQLLDLIEETDPGRFVLCRVGQWPHAAGANGEEGNHKLGRRRKYTRVEITACMKSKLPMTQVEAFREYTRLEERLPMSLRTFKTLWKELIELGEIKMVGKGLWTVVE